MELWVNIRKPFIEFEYPVERQVRLSSYYARVLDNVHLKKINSMV